jgi:hypothetical protein
MATDPVSSPTDILGSGLIVQLKIKLWTGSAELETNDIGMKPEELAEHFQLGRKLLVPKDALDPVRQVARRAKYTLEQLSHPLPDGGRFLLAQTTPEALAALHDHRQEFFEAVERFITAYPAARAAMESQWRAAAQTAWAKAGRPDTEDVFRQQFLARVAQLYPTEEQLRRKFDFFWLSYQLSLTGLREVSAARVAADEEKRRQADEAYRYEVQQRLAETLERSIGELHAQIAHTFERVLEHVKSGRPLRDGSLGRLRQSIERFRKLNVFGDSTLEQTIARFEQTCLEELDSATVSSSPDLRQVFQQGLESVLAAATAAGEVNVLTGRLRRQFDLGDDDAPMEDADAEDADEAAIGAAASTSAP